MPDYFMQVWLDSEELLLTEWVLEMLNIFPGNPVLESK
jgi:hypothetical protein